MPLFKQRVIEPELLDGLPADQARPNLADLVRLNRGFGGHSTIRALLRLVAERNEAFRILDVGAASGDTARLIQEEYPCSTTTSLDQGWVNSERAPQPKLVADAFRLPFTEKSFDFVICSLFLHHFTNDEISRLLASFGRVARRAVLVSDLERSVWPWLFLRFSGPIFGWNRVTVHDGLISVRAALRANELQALAKKAGFSDSTVKAFRPAFRLGLVAWTDRVKG